MSWTTWDFAPLVLVGAATMPAGRAPRSSCSPSRSERFVSPLDEAGDSYLLSAHMLQHVLIGDVVPALALVALRGPLVFFFPPSGVLRRLAHVRASGA